MQKMMLEHILVFEKKIVFNCVNLASVVNVCLTSVFQLVLLHFTPIHLTPYDLTPIYSSLYHKTPLSIHPSIILSRQLAVDIKGMFCHN